MMGACARRRRLWGDVAWTSAGVISATVALVLARWLVGLLAIVSSGALSLLARRRGCAERRSRH